MFSNIEQSNLWDSIEELSNSNFALTLTAFSSVVWCFHTLSKYDKRPTLSRVVFICITWFLLGLGIQLLLKKLHTNINQKTAFDFYTLNPHYPEDIGSQSIFCPILQGPSNQPICISYYYKNRAYSHVFDYASLIQWFNRSTLCPSNNIDLLLADVTQLNFSFDIPPEFLIEDELADEGHLRLMRI